MVKLLTRTELKDLLRSRGLAPRKRLGQNFLTDHNMLQLIADTACLNQDDFVLEIGPGPGVLTPLLLEKAGHVFAVEIDTGLLDICKEQLSDAENFESANEDILDSKTSMNQNVMARCNDLTSEYSAFKVVSNLPYSVATPVVLNLLESNPAPEMMVVLVQKEIADKFASAINKPSYGAVSVLLQAQAEVEEIRQVPPSLFWPKPEVVSSVLRITPRKEAIIEHEEAGKLREFIRQVFSQRRKKLPKVLAQMIDRGVIKPGNISKSDIRNLLESLGLNPEARAQELEPGMLVDIFKKMG